AIAGHEKKENRTALFVAASPFGTDQPYRLKVVLKHESQYAQHQFGRIRLAVSADDQIANLVPDAIRTLLATPDDKKTNQHKQQLKEHFRNNVCSLPEFRTLQQSQTELQSRKTKLTEQIPTTLVFREKAQLKPSYLLKRGEYDQQGEEVSRRTPLALPPMHQEWPNNRLGLAYWLVSEENPLTARVEVNRIWQSLFGVGLVKTTEDFGSQGEAPSHPELLDWLAIELRESGWDRKALLKKIMLSSAYQQSSRIIPAQLAADPQNRLISRGPRYRLDAEMLRDQALFVSGLLVEKIGGPSVKPPQPDGLWFAVGYTRSNTARFVPDEGAEKIHRRTLYTFLKRTAPAPQMAVFDGPSRESSCVRRERTNTPLQSLLLLNDPQYVEFSQGLAARAMRESASDPGQIATRIYRLCTGELPTADQLSLLVAGFEADREYFRAHPEQATAYLKTAALVPHEGLAEVDLAAWSLTSSLVLNLDQVVSKN
ncbi:MAG: DUF1553 domain-containing protein, partial [Planctomycetaceae bacterium]|nr:DUF1553 domain-containing protein [Planctomycetaceae bacterium]